MDSKKNRTIRPVRAVDPWRVFDLALLTAALRDSLLVAQLRSRKPRRLLPGNKNVRRVRQHPVSTNMRGVFVNTRA